MTIFSKHLGGMTLLPHPPATPMLGCVMESPDGWLQTLQCLWYTCTTC